MGLIFGNPAGFWALAAIPAILLIHFLQRETRRESVSTLFLIARFRRESRKGRRFERLRNATSLWLQILAALLLTWLLVEPRWLHPDSVQRVAVVLDDSLSMRAFMEPGTGTAELERALSRHERGAAATEWVLLESSGRRGTLYAGTDRRALVEAAAAWRPRSPTHDAAAALRRAVAAAHPGGQVLFVTDRRREGIPQGIDVLGIGESFGNAGFTGLRLEAREDGFHWHALLRNYGDRATTRSWWVEFDGRRTAPDDIALEAGGTVALRGRVPGDARRGTLVLEDDRFALDNRLPFVRPQTKHLTVALEPDSPLRDPLTAFLDSLASWRAAGPGEIADLRVTRIAPGEDPSGAGIFFVLSGEDPAGSGNGRPPVIAERHRLTENLSWQGLAVSATAGLNLQAEDSPLLWKGDRPLLALRERQGQLQLRVGFDLRHSNAARLPAFVVMLHRFMEEARAAKIGYARMNVHTGQRLNLAVDPIGGPVTLQPENGPDESVPASRAALLRAPAEPGFFSVVQGEKLLLEAAAHFADAREADFRPAESFFIDHGRDRQREYRVRNSHRDFLAPLWMLLLGCVLFAGWRYAERET